MTEDVASKTLFVKMRSKVPELNVDPDEWVRRMMSWHFSEETGSPYWLRRRRALRFDPRRDVRSVRDVQLFGLFDKDDLRRVPVGDLIPRGFRDHPRRVFETGGTSGPPCRVVDVVKGAYDVSLYHTMLEHAGLASGAVLSMTPAGPHAYGTFVTRLADRWCGDVCAIDLDPRWVKHLARTGKQSDAYVAHVVEQTRTLLNTQPIKLLFTTSRLLAALVQGLDRPLVSYGVRAVCTGGTSCSAEEERYLRDTFLKGIAWFDTYGNTLMGHALQGEAWTEVDTRSYYLPPPQAYMRIVDPANWSVDLPLGVRGQVLIVTLHQDLFIPNLLERDSAIAVGDHPSFPFRGITSIKPVMNDHTAVEGVY